MSNSNSQVYQLERLARIYYLKAKNNIFLSDSSIESPPSFKPAKKYSDLTGLPVSFWLFLYNPLGVVSNISLLKNKLQGNFFEFHVKPGLINV